MTAHQRTKLNELATDYRSVGVRKDSHSLSVFLDCYDVSLPELCVWCDQDAEAHLLHEDLIRGQGIEPHSFRVAVPVATFRVSPSGFMQRLDKVAA